MRTYERNIPWFCGGLLLLILIQGGVGALVVSTHLKPFIITIHMFLAVLLLFGLLYLRKYCQDLQDTSIVQMLDQKGLRLTRLLVGLTFLQVLMGTQVRQQVDHFMRDTLEATQSTIISFLGTQFYIHRSFSILILGLFFTLLIHFHRQRYSRSAFFLTLMAFFATLGNVVTGMMLSYFEFPANAQPFHLFFGLLSLGLLYSLSLSVRGTLLED
jgi:cytochrome c oxidase assembly protein subunit 15